ncbi:uncharacterized protein FFUJ_10097 [Fusarium fujikuroi IMI 58289]|uniref:LamG-like jellyroll fold domain-containing protein n=1 Tax=Gibberella fujikuroi (strain CBS 195.34 / IMI 58289 / NRRL A-6831) TaxID=1279085 RepID=S0EE49_GIBF5|nr:uncharacterized protein FFUJ_10097 [Fusarium fujikuroi IMI 58289]CCT73221.1 uncharacterized protein FFUJ_10097 [Fusarium fujikuroi IMI 58289]
MSLEDILSPNLNRYSPQSSSRYLSTRLVTHNGTTIAVALGKAGDGSLFFAYSILNAEEEDQAKKESEAKPSAAGEADKLDSQCWFDNAKILQFSSEVRVIGEESVPVYQIPAEKQKLNEWLSSSLCLMDPEVVDFQVLSDGRYVYLFRQGAVVAKESPNQYMRGGETGKPPVDGNLLCDRFVLVGSTLNRPLEARYQRSFQKQIPLNDKDTLGARDINYFFYEPTHSLRFVQDLTNGRFAVLRAPTVINGVTRWIIFSYSRKSGQIECVTTDTALNGLFDLHGHVYYTCKSENHTKVFENGPGSCTASRSDNGRTCNEARVPILPNTPASKRAIRLNGELQLDLKEDIDLSTMAEGFTLEGWINAHSPKEDANGSTMCLFSQGRDGSPSVLLDDKLRLVIRVSGTDQSILTSDTSLKADTWTHIATTYSVATQTYSLVINGVLAGSVSSPVKPGNFSGLGYQPKVTGSGFVGIMDEVRLWSYPFHPASIECKMSKRATGLESGLMACWHFDEESGTAAFDATFNSRELTIDGVNGASIPMDVWSQAVAPMVASYGLARRILRLPPSVNINGGISATIYNEQVMVSKSDADKEKAKEPSEKPKSQGYMRRGTRVLLCFVTGTGDSPGRLAVLDFGLLSDGTLPDTPASIPLPSLTLPSKAGTAESRVHTSLLYIGSQGVEMFGGILPSDAAECGSEAPFAFESAMGTVKIYFRAQGRSKNKLSALDYCISRSVTAAVVPPSMLGGHEGMFATCKFRQAKSIVFETNLCPWAPPDVAIQLTLTANLGDDKKIVETWNGVPAQLDKLYALLNGANGAKPSDTIGHMAELKELTPNNYRNLKAPPTELILQNNLTRPVTAGSYISIGMRYYMVLQTATEGKSVAISLQRDKRPQRSPVKGMEVLLQDYDHDGLVTSEGKPPGDFTKGSSLIAMFWDRSSTIDDLSKTAMTTKVQVPATSFINCKGQSPAFSSLFNSTCLVLDGDTIYSSLEDGVTTAPCAGICFESWIKVERASGNTIAVAYTAEHAPRAEGLRKEQQSVVLSVSKFSGGNVYDLVGSVNGLGFFVNEQSALKVGNWAHVACSARNTFALNSSGKGYIDLGTSAEWNLSDFSLVFTLQLNKDSSGEQTVLVKSESAGASTPIHIKINSSRQLQLSYWAANENGEHPEERRFYSPADKPFIPGEPYKVFISRKLEHITRDNTAPRLYQLVNMLAWRSDGSLHIDMKPDSVDTIKEAESKRTVNQIMTSGAQQTHGPAQGNEAPLCLGGASWSQGNRLQGIIGSILLYSSAILAPQSPMALLEASGNTKDVIGSWSGRDASGYSLLNDLGRNHGKFKGEGLGWVISPYKPDLQLSVFVNGVRVKYQQPSDSHRALLAQATPVGPHQLTLGNALAAGGNDDTRFLCLADNFTGEFDELRIWNVPRTRENICDSMHTRLTDVSSDVAAYLPFDETANLATDTAGQGQNSILLDTSVNCYNLTPLLGGGVRKKASEAPVGLDSPCVYQSLGAISDKLRGVTISACPSVAEYGDLQIESSGSMGGSYKRVYSFIESNGKWCLVTGFRIGSLQTEWVGNVQTDPTLIGFIEGAPPVPIENFIDQGTRPHSAISWNYNKRCIYTYSSRFEQIKNTDLSLARGLGAKWQVSSGIGVETETSAGQIKASQKIALDVSSGLVNNEVRTSTTNMNVEMEEYDALNMGLALVESETADLFALRLKMPGPVAPLIAYQLHPNPDIPRDRNTVSFKINSAYTKQGCLDGRRGLTNDPDYPVMSSPIKDASYFKPAEAYALREQIRRAEEQLEAEYERHSLSLPSKDMKLPQRTHRNICNTYVWTAESGKYKETKSTLDMVQSEGAINSNTRISAGYSLDMELAFGNGLVTLDVDAMYSAHFNFNMTKEKTTDEGFELEAQFPPHVDIRHKDPDTGAYVKRPGAVDAYRWMSFWLEPSVEATDTFFQKVIDPVWLEDPLDNDAKTLRMLREKINKEEGNARTKAWRVLHRCTYVSRVPEKVEQRPARFADTEDEKKTTPVADIAANWLLIQKLEPFERSAQSKEHLRNILKPHALKLFPCLIPQTSFYHSVSDLIADYIGLA